MIKKFAWCTPFSPASSVSEFSHTIAESVKRSSILTSEYQVDIFVNENGPTYPSSCARYSINSFLGGDTTQVLGGSYDHFIYNFGNNAENHEQIFRLSAEIPGIAILHDYVYQHYFAGKIFEGFVAPKAYALLMGRYYGQSALRSVAASRLLTDSPSRIGLWDSDLASRFPLIEAIVSNTKQRGVVVHSALAKAAVEKVYKGPILQLRLPGDEKEAPSDNAISQWKDVTARKEKINIALIGHIQRGKQIHHIINTFIRFPKLRDHTARVVIAGKPSDREYVSLIQRLISENSLGAVFKLELDVSHDRLQEIKEDTDLFVNIRYPNTEGGSGSLMEQMASNRPVIVLNTGIFSEVESGVIKISQLHDETELFNALMSLAQDSKLRIETGNAARRYTQELSSADYAARIFDFCEMTKKVKRPTMNKEDVLEPNQVLLFDSNVRTPEPFFRWSAEALAEFCHLIFGSYFRSDLTNMLVGIHNNDPIRAYRAYSLARTIIDVLDDKYVRGSEPRDWLIPHRLDDDGVFTVASLNEKYFADFLSLAGHRAVASADLVPKMLARFSVGTTLGNILLSYSFKLSGNNSAAGFQNGDLRAYAGANLSVSIIDIVKTIRMLLSLDESDFRGALLNKGEILFDREYYLAEHPDLTTEGRVTIENAFEHFRHFGQNESRKFRIDTSKLVHIIKNVEAT